MLYCNELESSIKQSESQNEKLLQQVFWEALRPVPEKVGKEPVWRCYLKKIISLITSINDTEEVI